VRHGRTRMICSASARVVIAGRLHAARRRSAAGTHPDGTLCRWQGLVERMVCEQEEGHATSRGTKDACLHGR
jgi:hypothetical protein